MTFSVDQGSWIIRQFDTADDETPYRFRFLRWVEFDGRGDLAAVEFIDLWGTSYGPGLQRAVLAARHSGYDLRSLVVEDLPVHVHVMTSTPELQDATHYLPGDLQRSMWATIEPEGVELPQAQAVSAFRVRRI